MQKAEIKPPAQKKGGRWLWKQGYTQERYINSASVAIQRGIHSRSCCISVQHPSEKFTYLLTLGLWGSNHILIINWQ
jgi:hypothetical protein